MNITPTTPDGYNGHLQLHDGDDPATQEPVDDKGMRGSGHISLENFSMMATGLN
jgi:hypothetical protein